MRKREKGTEAGNGHNPQKTPVILQLLALGGTIEEPYVPPNFLLPVLMNSLSPLPEPDQRGPSWVLPRNLSEVRGNHTRLAAADHPNGVPRAPSDPQGPSCCFLQRRLYPHQGTKTAPPLPTPR